MCIEYAMFRKLHLPSCSEMDAKKENKILKCRHFIESLYVAIAYKIHLSSLNFADRLLRRGVVDCLNLPHERVHDVHKKESNQYTNSHANECTFSAALYEGQYNGYDIDN